MFDAAGSLLLSYGAGALSTLSPCVLPILPIVLFGALEQHTWGPVALAAGLSTSFAALGIFVALLGFGAGVEASVLRFGAAMLMVGIGFVLLVPALQYRLAYAAGPAAIGGQKWIDRMKPSGLGGQFMLGALLGAVWSPCFGPTLGAAVGLAAQTETSARAALMMAVFALGAATPILVLAYGSKSAIAARRDWLLQVARVAKPLMALILIVVGGAVLTGFDKTVEASLTRAMPEWLVTVTTRF